MRVIDKDEILSIEGDERQMYFQLAQQGVAFYFKQGLLAPPGEVLELRAAGASGDMFAKVDFAYIPATAIGEEVESDGFFIELNRVILFDSATEFLAHKDDDYDGGQHISNPKFQPPPGKTDLDGGSQQDWDDFLRDG